MKYQNIHVYSNESFRRITGVKRHTFDKMVEILHAKYLEEHSSNSRKNGSKFKLIMEDGLFLRLNIFVNTVHTFILLQVMVFMRARYTASSNG